MPIKELHSQFLTQPSRLNNEEMDNVIPTTIRDREDQQYPGVCNADDKINKIKDDGESPDDDEDDRHDEYD